MASKTSPWFVKTPKTIECEVCFQNATLAWTHEFVGSKGDTLDKTHHVCNHCISKIAFHNDLKNRCWLCRQVGVIPPSTIPFNCYLYTKTAQTLLTYQIAIFSILSISLLFKEIDKPFSIDWLRKEYINPYNTFMVTGVLYTGRKIIQFTKEALQYSMSK